MLLALIAGLVGIPAPPATRQRRRSPTPERHAARASAVPRGRPRPSGLGQPADGPDAGRPRPRSRSSSGLVRNGPNGTIVPDLAARWSVDRDGRGLDVRAPRRRPLARRRAGHRGRRGVHHPRPCRIRRYTGPGAASWNGGDRPRRSGSPTVVVHPGDAARRLPPGRHPADRAGAPASRRCRSTCWPTIRSAGSQSGSGPFALTEPRRRSAPSSIPAAIRDAADPRRSSDPSAAPTDLLTTARADDRPGAPDAVPARDRVPVLRRRRDALADGLSARATSTRRPAPSPMASELAVGAPTAASLRYPGSTLTDGPAQPSRRTIRSSATRRSAPRCSWRDRPARHLIDAVRRRSPVPAPGPIPPSVVASCSTRRPTAPVALLDLARRAEGAEGGRLDADRRRLAPRRRRAEAAHARGAQPDQATSTRPPSRSPRRSLADWKQRRPRRHPRRALDPATFVNDRLAAGHVRARPSPT